MRKYHKKEAPVTKTCKECNKTFQVWASLLRHGKKYDFCSRVCFLASKTIVLICDTCKKEFNRSKASVGRYGNQKNFCSRACTNQARIKPGRKAAKYERYNSTEWRKIRLEVIERDGICQICSDTMANSVHHKNWNPFDNRLENLVLLCVPCHGQFKRWEEFDIAKSRMMAYSELRGDMQRAAEMFAPVN